MHSEEIPFNKFVGLKVSEKDGVLLELPEDERCCNHLGTIHASAQFTLAEASSGEFLLNTFPDLVDTTIPVVRDVEVKFRKPAYGKLYAKAECPKEEIENLRGALEKHGFVRLQVKVNVIDEKEVIVMKAKVDWVIQKREKE